MKKGLLTLIACFAGILAALLLSKPSYRAEASDTLEENTLYAFYEELTADTAAYYKAQYQHLNNNSTNLNSLQAGDYRIGISIANSTGYSSSGFRLEYDATNYDIIKMPASSTDPVSITGAAGMGLSVFTALAAEHAGRIAISTSGAQNNTQNGEIISFFLKLKPNANPSSPNPITNFDTPQFANTDSTDLETNVVEPDPEEPEFQYIIFYYILGDINGDGEVDTVDSTVLQQILNYMTSHNATIEQACEYYSSVTAGIGTPELLYITLVTDVNYDNLINADDVEDIQEYYQFIILEEPKSSQIGQFMCFTMLVPVTP